jgi:hypothetical protein
MPAYIIHYTIYIHIECSELQAWTMASGSFDMEPLARERAAHTCSMMPALAHQSGSMSESAETGAGPTLPWAGAGQGLGAAQGTRLTKRSNRVALNTRDSEAHLEPLQQPRSDFLVKRVAVVERRGSAPHGRAGYHGIVGPHRCGASSVVPSMHWLNA